MIHLLDTNICIYFLNRYSDRIVARFKKLSPSEIKLSAVTVAKLFFGAEKSTVKRKNWQVVESFVSVFETIPFDDKCTKIYAKIRASLERAGNPIGPMDLLIASISLANDFILVTNNTREFNRIKKLKLENWL